MYGGCVFNHIVACRGKFSCLQTRVWRSSKQCDYGDVVMYWCAAKEAHEEAGYHFHMSLKLRRSLRFSRPEAGCKVNFSEPPTGAGYYHAHSCVIKSDKQAVSSNEHPHNVVRPHTDEASRKRRRSRRCRFIADGTEPLDDDTKCKKPKKMTKSDVGDIVLEKSITTFDELLVEGSSKILCIAFQIS